MLLSGMAAFLPKYLEYQFGLTSGQAAMLVGAIIVPAGAGGTLLGGYLVSFARTYYCKASFGNIYFKFWSRHY